MSWVGRVNTSPICVLASMRVNLSIGSICRSSQFVDRDNLSIEPICRWSQFVDRVNLSIGSICRSSYGQLKNITGMNGMNRPDGGRNNKQDVPLEVGPTCR